MIVILSRPGGDWSSSRDVLSERYAYRVAVARSAAEALATMARVGMKPARRN